jgi:hypothetical protein
MKKETLDKLIAEVIEPVCKWKMKGDILSFEIIKKKNEQSQNVGARADINISGSGVLDNLLNYDLKPEGELADELRYELAQEKKRETGNVVLDKLEKEEEKINIKRVQVTKDYAPKKEANA